MEDLEQSYMRFIDGVIEEYRGVVFHYKSPVSSMDPDLEIVGRQGFKIEMKDVRNKRVFLGLDTFVSELRVASESAPSDSR
jgi:hypothetical protein